MNEKKTAEEILDKLDCTDDGYMHYSQVLPAMQEYAAQETAALREENERLKEALKELIPIAERALNYTWIPETEQDLQDAINDEFVNGPNRNYKIEIENAKKLTGQ